MAYTPEYSWKKKETAATLRMLHLRIPVLVFSGAVCVCVFVAGCSKTESSLLLQQINTKEYKDLTYIKPFTSLVGFNWKFCKDQKMKAQQIKAPKLALPILHW